MMKTFLIILPALAAAVMLSSCNRVLEPDSSFIGSSGIELTVGGSVILRHGPLTWQLGYNPTTKEFRASDDAMKSYFFVTCSAVPASTGQKLDATVTWTSGGSTQTSKGRFEVVKVQGDTYWLWNGDKKSRTGVTVRILR